VSVGREPALPYQQQLDQLMLIYEQAARALEAQAQAAVASGAVATARGRRAQLASLLRALDQLGHDTDPIARRLAADAYHQAANLAAEQIAGLNMAAPEIPGAFSGVSVQAVSALEDSILGRLRDARQTVGRQINDVFAREQRRAALEALTGAHGSPGAAAKALERNLRTQGLTAFTDRSGRQWSLDTYSRMATRTVTREAVVQGSIDRMLSHRIDIARVSSHASACKICQPWEGALISLSGDVTEYQGEPVSNSPDGIPPFHPNCAHSLMPVATAVDATRASLAVGF
jgi:hypothetical protein